MNKKEIRWRVESNGCWRCTSHKSWKGYPKMGCRRANGSYGPVAVAMIMLMRKAPKPAGFYALHKCGNKWCINPAHLYWGTQEQNSHDAIFMGQIRGSSKKEIEIRKSIALDDSDSMTGLSKKYNVSRSVVQYIKSGRSKTLELLDIPCVKTKTKYKRKYGFNLQEIGEQLGVSRQRVYQLHLKNSPRLKAIIEQLNKNIFS